MFQNNNQNIYTSMQIIHVVMLCLNFFTDGLKQRDPKEFDLTKYSSDSSKSCVLQIDIEYPKELRQSNNDYPLATRETETKIKMLYILQPYFRLLC